MNKYLKHLTDINFIAQWLLNFKPFYLLSDKAFIKAKFRLAMKKKLNLDNPVTMNEKLQWLKLNNRNDRLTKLVDKYEVREYIKEVLGEEYLIPLIGAWDDPDDIDFDALPEKFVLKCNHNSGLGMCICKDKSKLDIEKARKLLKKGIKQNYYKTGREWPYKNVKRKILCEKYITDDGKDCLTDYKFYCFNGKVDVVLLCIDRDIGDTKFYFFDREWNLKRYNIRGKNAPEGFTLPKPEGIDEMFEIAEKLSKGHAFVRVDLYYSNKQVYFGELTFYPQSGIDANRLPETDIHFGDMIDLNVIEKGDIK